MSDIQFVFDNEQLNRLFPYYILINKDFTISGYGSALSKIVPFSAHHSFKELFKMVDQADGTTHEPYFTDQAAHQLSLILVSNPDIYLQGSLEYLKPSGQFLFIGTLKAAPQSKVMSDLSGDATGNALYNNDFYGKVLNKIPADIVVFDTNHVYQFLNAGAISDPELRQWLVGKTDEDYCIRRNRPLSLAAERRANFNEVMKTKHLKSWEEEIVKPDGSKVYLLRNMYPVLDEHGEVELVIGYGINITDRKLVEEQLEVNEKRYRDLYNFSPALIYTHDPEGMLLTVNPAICSVLGYNSEEIVNKNIKSLLPAIDQEKIQNDYLNKINVDGQSKGVFRMNHKNGGTKYLLYQNFRVEENGNSPYIIGFSQDITDRIKTEKELLLAKHATENIAKVKETFLANMSHEIRTPMNGILGVTNLLAKTRLDDQQNNYANLISESVNNLLTIINDILDMEKIGSGGIEFENQPFKVVDKIWSVIQTFQHKAEQKNLSLVFNNDLPANLVVIGDQYRLAQVITNLLSNAIKFTHRGSITTALGLIHYSEQDVIIEFSVHDTGIGISESRFGVIFDPFVQASSNTTRKFGGTGLGLSICKSLVEMQGGHIKVSSKLNEGTTFTFNLRYKRGALQMVQEPKRDRLHFEKINKRILVAEDIELNQFLVRTSLESWGCQVDIAGNGLEAIKKVKQSDYDLILMDIQMPEMDGLTATRHIREMADTDKAHLPIIAFTANALKGDSKQYIDAGMNDYIIKPYTEDKLHEKIIETLKTHEHHVARPQTITAPVAAAPAEEAVPEPVEVVVVNNDPAVEDKPKLYNISMIESIGKNNPAFVDKMIVMFVDIISKDFDTLKGAAADNNWDEVAQIAHKMKSTFGNMGVTSLLQQIRDLESRAENPRESVEVLEKELTLVLAQLKGDYPVLFPA